jgi:ribosomal protein S18 acetylase RimI-like enzyme
MGVVTASMVVTATGDTTWQAQGRLRPMDPARDLKTIADLIADAFADELDERGRAALRELRWMGRLSPFVWWWSQADPSFEDTFNGFVWEVPSPTGKGLQVVGNVSLSRAPGSRHRYILCNIVVQDAYQGQAIGRRLTEAAIAEARDLGGEGVVLQVYQGNLPALQLYTSLGLQEVAAEIELQLEAIQSVAVLDAPGYLLRPWRTADGEAIYQLARSTIPSAQQWLRPVKLGDYQLSGWPRLGQWVAGRLAGQEIYRLTVLRDDQQVAMMAVTAAFRRGDHRLSLLVHPDHAGQVEAALVSRALNMLPAIPPRPIRVTLDKSHTAARKVLRDYGFVEQRVLLTLSKDF